MKRLWKFVNAPIIIGSRNRVRAGGPGPTDLIRGGSKGPSQGPFYKDRGVALLVVITWLALMIALVGEFTFGTTVDAAEAANARDELRAHYMARSSVNLARLLIKIQTKFIDPVMAQAQTMLKAAMGGSGGTSGAPSPAAPAGGLYIFLIDVRPSCGPARPGLVLFRG